MKSSFGERLGVTLSGESHGPYVEATAVGFPRGIKLDDDLLLRELARRRGGGQFSTPRKEDDLPIFLSGIQNGVSTGEPLIIRIENKNFRRHDYAGFGDTPRPSHADYPAQLRYGSSIDLSGGGHFSARVTAPLVALGALAKAALLARGVRIGGQLNAVGKIAGRRFDSLLPELDLLDSSRELPTLSRECEEAMADEIRRAQEMGDSVGGIIECAAVGMPAGVGSPLGAGLENRLSSALFVLGGVRGIEFGDGFAAAAMCGSAHNDPYIIKDGRIATESNHAGGIVAGISTGMPIIFRVAMKPTASIAREQKTVSLSEMKETTIKIGGRHDPCIAIRALPCVEAVAAIVLLEAILEKEENQDEIT